MRGVRTHAVAARRLCRVKRGVGASEDGIDVSFAGQRLRDPKAGGELDRAARAEDGGCRETCAKVFGNARCTFGGGVRKDEEEFLAAVAAAFVADAECLAQDPADANEHLVAAEMPLPVVDGLEVIEIEHHDRKRHVRALRATQFGAKPLDAVMSRHAPGQWFDDGEIANLSEQLHVLDRDRQQRSRGVENFPLVVGERQVVVAHAEDADEFLLRDEWERVPRRLARAGAAGAPLQPPRSNHRLPSTFLGREPEVVTGHERLKVVDDDLLQRLRIERLRERLREPHQDFELAGTILEEKGGLAQRSQLPAARLVVGTPGAWMRATAASAISTMAALAMVARTEGDEADDRLLERAPQECHAGDRCRDGDPEPHRQACARAARRRFVDAVVETRGALLSNGSAAAEPDGLSI